MTYPPVQIVLSQVVEEEVARGEQINLRVIAGESSMFLRDPTRLDRHRHAQRLPRRRVCGIAFASGVKRVGLLSHEICEDCHSALKQEPRRTEPRISPGERLRRRGCLVIDPRGHKIALRRCRTFIAADDLSRRSGGADRLAVRTGSRNGTRSQPRDAREKW